jgi:hypothetical protein
MTERWEYMSVIWVNSVEEVSRDPVKYGWANDLYIWRPGAEEAERLPEWSSRDKSVTGPSELDVLNELGAEGWELVGREVLDSVVGKLSSGWSEGGFPVRTRATLKRRLED